MTLSSANSTILIYSIFQCATGGACESDAWNLKKNTIKQAPTWPRQTTRLRVLLGLHSRCQLAWIKFLPCVRKRTFNPITTGGAALSSPSISPIRSSRLYRDYSEQ